MKENTAAYRASKSYRSILSERLNDRDEAARYLNASIDRDDPALFLLALKDVVHARKSVSQLAKETKLNRVNLYTLLSNKGNPSLTSLDRILKALGLRIRIATR